MVSGKIVSGLTSQVSGLQGFRVSRLGAICARSLFCAGSVVESNQLYNRGVDKMPNHSRVKLKVFEIAYKSYYHELSDWSHDHIKAVDKKNALRIFASRHHIKTRQREHPENWRWWNGEWYMAFRYIHEIQQKPKPCPHCQGTGIIVTKGV